MHKERDSYSQGKKSKFSKCKSDTEMEIICLEGIEGGKRKWKFWKISLFGNLCSTDFACVYLFLSFTHTSNHDNFRWFSMEMAALLGCMHFH